MQVLYSFLTSTYLHLLLVLFALIYAMRYAYLKGEDSGKNEKEAETANEALDDVSKANAVVDKWNTDSDVRKRVRAKYTRK